MLYRMADIMNGLIVNASKMADRVNSSNEWESQSIMLKYINDGMSRKEAHDKVQNMDIKECVSTELLNRHLQNVSEIFSRVK
jgi:adenylosuccinate lyase